MTFLWFMFMMLVWFTALHASHDRWRDGYAEVEIPILNSRFSNWPRNHNQKNILFAETNFWDNFQCKKTNFSQNLPYGIFSTLNWVIIIQVSKSCRDNIENIHNGWGKDIKWYSPEVYLLAIPLPAPSCSSSSSVSSYHGDQSIPAKPFELHERK